MVTQECKKCKKRYGTLVHGICHNCDPVAWDIHFRKLYNKKNK